MDDDAPLMADKSSELTESVEHTPSNDTQTYPAVFSTNKSTDSSRQSAFNLAADENQSPEDARLKVGSGVVNADPITVIAGLLVVVALILMMAWLMRRSGAIPMVGGGQAIKIVGALSVGTREKVVLVDVGGKQILLGIATGRVSHLQTFDEAVVDLNATNTSDFSTTIKKLLQPGVVAKEDDKK
jgi:flagellar protein FliO/FliZ